LESKGLCPLTPLKNFLKEVFKNFKNFDMPKLRFGEIVLGNYPQGFPCGKLFGGALFRGIALRVLRGDFGFGRDLRENGGRRLSVFWGLSTAIFHIPTEFSTEKEVVFWGKVL